ncbi:MAG: dolichyl-phosphate beta-glucosyltransferase [Candidatus Omnitrophota bacterium]
MYLSIVIPAYNEEKRIKATLSNIYDFLRAKGFDYEVIVVDDGSADKTVVEAQGSSLFTEGNLCVIKNWINVGKGFSVKRGILATKGEYVLFTDADLSTPIEELDKLLGVMSEGYDIVIGSRSAIDSDVRIHQPWYRERMGKVFNAFVKLFLLEEFNDTQCGFKLFKGDAARRLALLLKIDSFCFDVELLYLAKLKGYKVKEAGVVWNNSPQSKVRAVASSVSMFIDLIKIKKLHRD